MTTGQTQCEGHVMLMTVRYGAHLFTNCPVPLERFYLVLPVSFTCFIPHHRPPPPVLKTSILSAVHRSPFLNHSPLFASLRPVD